MIKSGPIDVESKDSKWSQVQPAPTLRAPFSIDWQFLEQRREKDQAEDYNFIDQYSWMQDRDHYIIGSPADEACYAYLEQNRKREERFKSLVKPLAWGYLASTGAWPMALGFILWIS